MFNYNSTSKQQLVYFHMQVNMHTNVKMASRPCGSISFIVSDVPGDSNSSGLSNTLNDSDTLVSIWKEGRSSVWTDFGYEANSSEVKEGKMPDIVICHLCKKSIVAKGGKTLLICYPIWKYINLYNIIKLKQQQPNHIAVNRARKKQLHVIPLSTSR